MTDKSLFSPSWYRVSKLKPRLRGHAKVHRQIYRGQKWYVLQDHATGRYHRFSPAAHLVISLMDGSRSVQEIWDVASRELGDDLLTQDEVIRLLAQLHQSDILHADVPPDIVETMERKGKQQRRRLLMNFANPLAIRLPILDPERFIRRTYPFVSFFFGWFGAAVIIGLVSLGVVLAALNWPALTENISDRVLAAKSLLLIFLTYPFVKAFHELGHAYAVKHWGGEVHEIGIMFLVFMPVPYVDASAAASFRNKWRRALVGAAGIIVELILASIALIIWLNLEPGLWRAFAFNVMLIGGVSTLLFNGNPLLRFDGYYVLSDLIEIPNLYQRSNRYLFYLVQRYLYGIPDAVSPASAPGEKRWFVLYAIASFLYRLSVVVVIVTFVASKFFILGVVMAIWSVATMYLFPVLKGVWFLMTSATLRRRRLRAYGVTAASLGAIAAFLLLVPLPYATIAEGVVWAPGNSVLHARTEGMVDQLLVQPNTAVKRGDRLIVMSDPFLASQGAVLEAEVKELALRLEAAKVDDRAEAKIVRERLRHARAQLDLNRQRAHDLVIRSPIDGVFVLPRAADIEGKFLRKGQLVGYVTYPSAPIVRVVVMQADIDLVRQRTRAVSVRVASKKSELHPAKIKREIPSLSNRLPNLALSTQGGGHIALDPRQAKEGGTIDRVFQLELRMPGTTGPLPIGERVYVRFDHGKEVLAVRLYRFLRQQFLKRFNV